MDFYIELTDEHIEFIKYALTLSGSFAKQIFPDTVIYSQIDRNGKNRCAYSLKITSDGPRIFVGIGTEDEHVITIDNLTKFEYVLHTKNPWTNIKYTIQIVHPADMARRRKVEEFKKLIPTATFLREVVENYGVCWHRINHEKTQSMLDHNKLYIISSWVDGEIEEKENAAYLIDDIVDKPEIFALYSMTPTEIVMEHPDIFE